MAIINGGFRVVDYFPVMSEYKVNPHIRNKQSLDMDLVLVCQKRTIPFESLSSQPEQVLQRVINDLPSGISDNSDNKLFLHFVGELLRTASSIQDDKTVSYNWFAEALAHFDVFLTNIERSKDTTQYEASKPRQLRLLETGGSENSGYL